MHQPDVGECAILCAATFGEWSAAMALCCIGINNGSDVPLMTEPFIERENWIADFRMFPIICHGGKDDIELTVDGYDLPRIDAVVLVTLRRRGNSIPIFKSLVLRNALFGKPELKWAEFA